MFSFVVLFAGSSADTPAIAGVGWTANDRNQSHTHQEAGSWMNSDGRLAVVDENEMNWLMLNE